MPPGKPFKAVKQVRVAQVGVSAQELKLARRVQGIVDLATQVRSWSASGKITPREAAMKLSELDRSLQLLKKKIPAGSNHPLLRRFSQGETL